MEEASDYLGVLYRFIAHYQKKEFVGQKAIYQEIEEVVGGDSCGEVLDVIWAKIQPWLKREVLVDGDNFNFAGNETPEREEIANFIIFQ